MHILPSQGLLNLKESEKISETSRRFSGDLAIEVYDRVNAKPTFEIPKLNLSYKDFKLGLTSIS